jgi:hypothetical protein
MKRFPCQVGPVLFSIAGGNAENADPLVTGDGVKLFAGTENDID